MKNTFILLFPFACFFLGMLTMFLLGTLETSHKFFDSNGEEIPIEVVQLHSRGHFVILDSAQQETVDKYYW